MVRNVLVVSDSFKGTIDSRGVGNAVRSGWLRARPEDEVRVIPVADGGEGTLDAIEAAVSGVRRQSFPSVDPQGNPRSASWLMMPDDTAVIELAETCGIGLTDPLAPMTAHTEEFGRAIVQALDAGAVRLVLAIGGSASTDGGVGMLRALGAQFSDNQGTPISAGGKGLSQLHQVNLDGLRPLPPGGVTVFVDVDSPLIGPRGAAHIFGPQKGADPRMIDSLDAALAKFADLTQGPADTPGAGAAGGTGYGLLLWGARMRPGAEGIAELVDLESQIESSDIVITGEGAYDAQTAQGKLPSLVRSLAQRHNVPALLIAGVINASTNGFRRAVSLTELAGSSEAAMADPAAWIIQAGRQLAV